MEIGIPISDDLTSVHSYLDGWLTSIKKDPSYIFRFFRDFSG
jgi:hypothetical protein